MNAFNNLNISKKFAAGFALVVTVVVVMCVTVFVSVASIGKAVAQNDESVSQLNTTAAILTALVERQNAVRGFVASGDNSFIEKIATQQKAYEAAIAHLAQIAPEDAALVNQVKADADHVTEEQDQQVTEAKDPARRAKAQGEVASAGRLTKVREALKSFDDQESTKLSERAKAQTKTQNTAELLLIIGGVISTLMSAAMGWALTRAIAKPIGEMTSAMGRLAAGDHAVEVPAVGRKDEVGSMADAVQTFKESFQPSEEVVTTIDDEEG